MADLWSFVLVWAVKLGVALTAIAKYIEVALTWGSAMEGARVRPVTSIAVVFVAPVLAVAGCNGDMEDSERNRQGERVGRVSGVWKKTMCHNRGAIPQPYSYKYIGWVQNSTVGMKLYPYAYPMGTRSGQGWTSKKLTSKSATHALLGC
jgi:hypothetical protein